jgi:hypothetical protein
MTKELGRKELYDLICSKPMSTISREYGLPDRSAPALRVYTVLMASVPEALNAAINHQQT